MKNLLTLKISIIKSRAAFTLAEVLITLIVIGVLAALTVPGVMTNIQNRELKSAFKKIYSDMSAAAKLVINNNAGSPVGLCEDDDNDCARNLFANYLTYVKKCDSGTGTIEGNCWVTSNKLTKFNGSPYGYWDDDTHSGIVLSNGAYINFFVWHKNCDLDMSVLHDDAILICSEIFVDVNGSKSPNRIGRDIFSLYLSPKGILPDGIHDSYSENFCATLTSGWGCAAWVLQDKDY